MRDGSRDPHCSQCTDQQLTALYHLNIMAKQYADAANSAYNAGAKRSARIHSQRKKALYSLKRSILEVFIDNGCADKIRTHDIDGRTYYCVYVDDFSFHTPASEWDTPPPGAPTTTTTLTDFDADPSTRSTNMSEREALTRLTDTFESPNYHLESPFTGDNMGVTFVGWSYLPGALEEGDRVPDRYLYDRKGEDDFLFATGDTFRTSKGKYEILNRYHAYLTPWLDRAPLLQREAYDVLLNGTKKECIRERRIVDDWCILAESIADPLPHVDGPLSDMARSAIERRDADPVTFEIGDILEIQPTHEDESSFYCRLTEVHVSETLLIGQYEPVPPSEEAPMGLCIDEIADDVVAVHQTPPVQE